MVRNISSLKGMYIIVSTSEKYKRDMFLVNESKFRGKKWSFSLSTAKGYSNRYEAEGIAIKFRFGNPRVVLVTDKMVEKELNYLKKSFCDT